MSFTRFKCKTQRMCFGIRKTKNQARVIFHAYAATLPMGRSF